MLSGTHNQVLFTHDLTFIVEHNKLTSSLSATDSLGSSAVLTQLVFDGIKMGAAIELNGVLVRTAFGHPITQSS